VKKRGEGTWSVVGFRDYGYLIKSDVIMNVMLDCGGSVDKVRLPHSYWQTLLFMLCFRHSISVVTSNFGPIWGILICAWYLSAENIINLDQEIRTSYPNDTGLFP
jgi:hypothetical protein